MVIPVKNTTASVKFPTGKNDPHFIPEEIAPYKTEVPCRLWRLVQLLHFRQSQEQRRRRENAVESLDDHMSKTIATVFFLEIFFLCGSVYAQEDIFTIKMLLKRQASEIGLETDKDKALRENIILPLKREHILIHAFDIFKHIEKQKGRLPLHSQFNGKVQIEFGFSGYLGIKISF